jgi:hypothetical protein
MRDARAHRFIRAGRTISANAAVSASRAVAEVCLTMQNGTATTECD